MSGPTLQQTFDAAVKAHQNGQLADAEKMYRAVLAAQPNHADAIHLLGVIAQQSGRSDIAHDLIRRALSLHAFNPDYHTNLGMVLVSLGRLDEAIASHRRALALNPRHGSAWNNLGVALKQRERLDEALDAWQQAVEFAPGSSDPYNNLGSILLDRDRVDEALVSIRKAIALRPNNAEALHNLGVAMRKKGNLPESIAAFQKSLQYLPNSAETYNDLGISLQKQKQPQEAYEAFRRAAELKPSFIAARANLACIFREMGRYRESVEAFTAVVRADPDYPDAMNNLGRALHDDGRIDDAMLTLQEAMRRKPDDAAAHWNVGLLMLMRGEFERGWAEYEHRYDVGEFTHFKNVPRPLWEGSDLAGRRLLLFAEQGFGDTLQLIRYLPQVVQRVGPVSVMVQPELRRLLSQLPGVTSWHSEEEKVPKFDVYCSLFSLPLRFGTTLATVPHDVPYLRSEPEMSAKWKSRLAGFENRIKIGISWAGRPTHPNDARRTLALSRFAPLVMDPRLAFFSLQKGPAAAQAKTAPAGMELIDWSGELNDFADTAALIDHLDLVISVDTALVHLAGAMGRPTWVLVPYPPDWRWMLNRTDSPWYPTMRLFRQTKLDDWEPPLQELTQALAGRIR